jgi:uncharacterized membrane protein YhaH (DUF805 family)
MSNQIKKIIGFCDKVTSWFYGHDNRIGRLGYLLGSLFVYFTSFIAIIIIYFTIYILADRLFPTNTSHVINYLIVPIVFVFIGWIVVLVCYIYISGTNKRLHDFNLSGYWQLLMYCSSLLIIIMPASMETFLSLLHFIIIHSFLLLCPGTKGTNRFGKTHNQEQN